MSEFDKFYVCECRSSEHILRFTSYLWENEAPVLYASVFLGTHQGFFKRVWVAIKYVFGYKPKYGHWDEFIFQHKDAEALQDILKNYIVAYNDCTKTLKTNS